MSRYQEVAFKVKEIVSAYDGTKEPWVVFDIDETLITGREYQGKAFFQAQAMGRLLPISEMVGLHNWLQKKYIKVALITARHPGLDKATVSNLINAGIRGKSILYSKKRGLCSMSFKTSIRRKIYSEGGIILANIGDQKTDIEGGYSEHTFLLPSTY